MTVARARERFFEGASLDGIWLECATENGELCMSARTVAAVLFETRAPIPPVRDEIPVLAHAMAEGISRRVFRYIFGHGFGDETEYRFRITTKAERDAFLYRTCRDHSHAGGMSNGEHWQHSCDRWPARQGRLW